MKKEFWWHFILLYPIYQENDTYRYPNNKEWYLFYVMNDFLPFNLLCIYTHKLNDIYKKQQRDVFISQIFDKITDVFFRAKFFR